MAADTKAFRARFPIRWSDVDSAQVIFYGKYLHLFEAVEDEFFRQHELPIHELQRQFGIWMPRVETHSTFFFPARFGDVVEVELQVGALKKSSARFNYEVKRADPQPAQLLARGYNVIVCVSQENFRAVPIPEPMRQLLGRYLLPTAGTTRAARS